MTAVAVSVTVGALSAGCSAPSLLITPVTSSRRLVETELSRDSLLSLSKIAVIDVTGLILNAPKPQLLGKGEHPVSVLLEQLDKARKDPWVKGLVLRINSPGGSVTASELMHAEIMRFKQSGKPIKAVMMDVAASGGYYIACACDEIIAHRSTVTGSIGVIMQLFDLSGTMQKIGLRSNAITSGVHKDTASPFRPMRPEERELLQAIVNDMYEQFIRVVAAGRPGIDEAEVRRLADGRVYLAPKALDAGLIDRIGTLPEVIQDLKREIGARGVRVVMYHRPAEYRPNYYAATPHARLADINFFKVDFPNMLQTAQPRFMYVWTPGG
ncbi:MAG: signal peptide peptidase SppA [Phycisphaerae bacterium]